MKARSSSKASADMLEGGRRMTTPSDPRPRWPSGAAGPGARRPVAAVSDVAMRRSYIRFLPFHRCPVQFIREIGPPWRHRTGQEVEMRIGYAAGAFDLFHVEHLNLLAVRNTRRADRRRGQRRDAARSGHQPVIPTEGAQIVGTFGSWTESHRDHLKLDAWRESVSTSSGRRWRGTLKDCCWAAVRCGRRGDRVPPYTLHTSSTVLRRHPPSPQPRTPANAGPPAARLS